MLWHTLPGEWMFWAEEKDRVHLDGADRPKKKTMQHLKYFKRNACISIKILTVHTFWPRNSTSRILSCRNIHAHTQKYMHKEIYYIKKLAVLWLSNNRTVIEECLKKSWYSHTTAYSAVNKEQKVSLDCHSLGYHRNRLWQALECKLFIQEVEETQERCGWEVEGNEEGKQDREGSQ